MRLSKELGLAEIGKCHAAEAGRWPAAKTGKWCVAESPFVCDGKLASAFGKPK